MSNTSEQWEEEFNALFKKEYYIPNSYDFMGNLEKGLDVKIEDIKDFIRKEKALSYAQGKKDAVEEIIKKIKTSGLIFETFTIDTVMGILESSLTPNQNSV